MYTQGYDLITAGSSAGGYMATIMGIKLDAKFVINIGGHWNLYRNNDTVERYYYLKKYKTDIQREKWYDLSSIVENNTVPVFYLYGANNESDLVQARCTENMKNVYMIALQADTHAPGVSTEAYLQLLMADWKEIKELYSMNHGKVIKADELARQIKNKLGCPKVN